MLLGLRLGTRASEGMNRTVAEYAPAFQASLEVPRRHVRGPRQIALLTPLSTLPSPGYHLEVIRSLAREAAGHGLATALHDVDPGEVGPAVAGILRAFRPAAVVMLRLTPDPAALELLAHRRVPVVLVHADRYRYPCPPVLAHVIPDQEAIAGSIASWTQRHSMEHSDGPVVVVAMPREQGGSPFEASLRNRRIELVLEGLRAHSPILVTVPDYSFRHAPAVLAAHPDARAFVCLGDELAVAIKQILVATGRPWRGRVLGFDDSRLAQAEGIPSFGQQLERM